MVQETRNEHVRGVANDVHEAVAPRRVGERRGACSRRSGSDTLRAPASSSRWFDPDPARRGVAAERADGGEGEVLFMASAAETSVGGEEE